MIRLFREILDTPIGAVVVLSDRDGRLRSVDFDDGQERMTRLLDRRCGRGRWSIDPAADLMPAGRALAAYFAGDLRAIDMLEVETNGSRFQEEVWTALRHIPAGTTLAYGMFATRLGQPSASRAVGFANGANPIAIVVPCHRLVGADGSLTGYAGGIARKRWLIDHEQRHEAGTPARDPCPSVTAEPDDIRALPLPSGMAGLDHLKAHPD